VKERTSTWNMTEFEANVWFCENVGNHTVWQRQNKDYVLPESLTAKQAHHNKCKEWIKKAKKRLDNEEKKSKEEKGK
jgi:hypothetical protein